MWRSIGKACLQKEGVAFVALIALIGGSVVQTAMLGWIVSILEDHRATEPLANIAYGLLATVAIILLSLTLALGRRSISAEFWKAKFQASNGEDHADPAK